MSHRYEDTYDVYDERLRKAKKPHVCAACSEPILRGDYYHSIFIVFDARARRVVRCLRCQKIHEHLRELAPGEMWPDEELACGEDYREHWGEDPPAEIAALAFRSHREMQSAAKPGSQTGDPRP